MKSKFKNLLIPALSALISTTALSGGTFVLCTAISVCTFGKYKGKITLINPETQAPLSDRKVRAYIDYDGAPIPVSNNYFASRAITNDDGEAVIGFDRSFSRPLTIITSFGPEPYTQSQFTIYPRNIRSQSTLTGDEIKRYINAASAEKDPTDLTLEIYSWSLF